MVKMAPKPHGVRVPPNKRNELNMPSISQLQVTRLVCNPGGIALRIGGVEPCYRWGCGRRAIMGRARTRREPNWEERVVSFEINASVSP